MKKLKKFLRPLGIALLVIGVTLALGFVERTTDRTPIGVRSPVLPANRCSMVSAPSIHP